MTQQGPGPLFAAERRKWAWRGLAGGLVFGLGLMTFLLFVAGKRAELDSPSNVLAAYALMALLSAALGAVLGWFHGGTEAARQLANTGQQPEHWGEALQQAGMGFRIGLIVAVLYVVVALGVFLEDRAFPPWFLALRAAMALVAFPVGTGLFGFFVGLSRPR